MLNVNDRDLVIPGQLLGGDIYHDLNCFRVNDVVYSSVEGMVRVDGKQVKVIPSTGRYLPKRDDVIIGVVTNVLVGRFLVDVNSPYTCYMRGEEVSRDVLREDLTKYFKVGDILTAKISDVNEVYSCQLIKPWKIKGGLIIDVNPKRVPRIVGKKKSMLNMIKEKTQCKIIVGQNGKIWIRDGDVDLAVKVIKKIERYAQMQGLTNRMAKILDKELR